MSFLKIGSDDLGYYHLSKTEVKYICEEISGMLESTDNPKSLESYWLLVYLVKMFNGEKIA